ncbi:MAG TPA: tetratricopeptide repeat protein, partial [Streptosporangiaceae bacterium]|nr:tetratricopeptide repeat protein [Streptosporangiaceae bacterium]
PGTVVISAIGGTAGVGKTALAVRWAHQVAGRFPDGQLYVNLRGYDADQPVAPADALAGFLSALGVPGPDTPAGEEERAARYRSLLADRRMLVVLDNAAEVEQVRLLLPGAPACMVVVTSRDALAGLVARYGATRLDLDLLPLGEAVGLLRALIGPRVDADPGVAVALAERCARLPLALRVAAELAAARPDATLAELCGELGGLQRRLDLLDAGGDPRTAVRAVFSWSRRHLDADAARAFGLLGLHPGADFDRYAAAALTGTTLPAAGLGLDRLARAHLIHRTPAGRYGLHDLLREYAAEQAARDENGPARQAAVTRLLDYYLHAAAAAMDVLYPTERHRRPRIPEPATPVPPLAGPAAAQAWLDAERAVLAVVTGYAAARGWPGHATRLAATVHRYLDTGGHYPDAVTIHGHARRAARQAGDRAAEATALNSLGVAAWRQGRHQQAVGLYQQALTLYRAVGDQTGEARALANLGIIDWQQGRYQQAADHHEQALALYRAAGDRVGETRALGNLGVADWQQGRYEQAAGHQRRALALYREAGDRAGEARALANLGNAEERMGRYEQAAGHLQQALALARASGDRYGEAHALTSIGSIEHRLGRPAAAAGRHREALALFRATGDPSGEAEARNGLGEALLTIGPPGPAAAQHAAALGLATQTGEQYEQARAHDGLARARHAAGELDQARRHWQEALARYAGLGVPEASIVRDRLAAMAGPS